MKKNLILGLLSVLVIISYSFAQTTGAKNNLPIFKKITPKEGKELLKQKNTFLLDVRTLEEYKEKHIPKAHLIPLQVLQQEIEKKVTDKNQPIVIYCRSGSRSASGAKILKKLGYTTIYDMGGIINWPYETETGIK